MSQAAAAAAQKRPTPPPIFGYSRTLSFGAFLMALIAQFFSFWITVCAIYTLFVVVAWDIRVAPELHNYVRLKRMALVVILVLATAFSWRVVFVRPHLLPEVLTVGAMAPDENGLVYGIKWKPEYEALQFGLSNQSDWEDYSDLRLTVHPNHHGIAVLHEISGADCRAVPLATGGIYRNDTTHISRAMEVGAWPDWEIRCGKILKNDLALFVVAIIREPNRENEAVSKLHLAGTFVGKFGREHSINEDAELKELTGEKLKQ